MVCRCCWSTNGSCAGLGGYGHADYRVALLEVDSIHAVGGAAHGADVIFAEADGYAFVRGDEHDLAAVGEAGGDDFVSSFHVDTVDALAAAVQELAQPGVLQQ